MADTKKAKPKAKPKAKSKAKPKAKRKEVTMTGQKRNDPSVGEWTKFFDKYGPVSNILRLLGLDDDGPHPYEKTPEELIKQNPAVKRAIKNIHRLKKEGVKGIKLPKGPFSPAKSRGGSVKKYSKGGGVRKSKR